MKIEHIAIWTANPERLKNFYQTYFGAEASTRYTNPAKQFSSYFLSFVSGARLEIMHRPDIFSAGDSGTPVSGVAHFAFSTGSEADVDRLTKRLIADGFLCIDSPRHTGDGYYESVILDPDGNRVEITV